MYFGNFSTFHVFGHPTVFQPTVNQPAVDNGEGLWLWLSVSVKGDMLQVTRDA